MGAESTPQNIYDDPAFFAAYSRFERFGAGWTTAMERGDFLGLLPDVAGARVLDLGCGAGQLAHHLAEAGAAEVVGIDVSERMLGVARSEWAHPRVTHRRLALEDAAFPPNRFELAVSSLAFHYVEDYPRLVGRVASWLTPGGVLVFSTEHPIYTAGDQATVCPLTADGERARWEVDDYAEEGLREQRWLIDGVRKYHRTLATLVNGPIDAGMVVERVVEPVPSEDALTRRSAWVHERRRPTFLLVRARKP